MSSIDDLPLDPGRDVEHTALPEAPSSRGPTMAVVAVLVAVLIAAGGYYAFLRPPPPATATPVAETATAAARATTASAPVVPALPPLTGMDPYVRTVLATLSSHPELLKWLATDDLIGAIVTAIDRLAQGQSPARDLAVLRPTQRFAVSPPGGTTHVDPTTYARYASLTAAVASVDPAALATAFSTLRPRLVESWVAHGHSDASFDAAVRKAIDVVATTPDVPADAALVPGTGGYAYADPAIERLPAAQKHLLRMGPAQVARVRDAARRFGVALTPPPR